MYFVESETVYLYQLMLLTVLELPKPVPPEPVSSNCRLQGGGRQLLTQIKSCQCLNLIITN